MKPKEIAENLQLAQGIMEQWLRFRKFYQKGVSEEPIAPEEETEYLETTSSLAQSVRKLAQRVNEKEYPFKSKEISALLKSCISINHFRSLAEGDRRTAYKQWHECQVYLGRTVGAFKLLAEGYRAPEKKGAKKKKGGAMKPVLIVVAVIIAAVIGYAVMNA